jgi:hypothetical protein
MWRWTAARLRRTPVSPQGDVVWPHAGDREASCRRGLCLAVSDRGEDAQEDRAHGSDQRGDEMPDWAANKAARLERIRAAKAFLEAEAKQPPHDEDGPGRSSGMMKSGKPQRGLDGGPPDRAQRNFTDPDSRIQPLRSKVVIAEYYAQTAVDSAHQIIVAERLQTSSVDARALPGLLADIRAVLGANPEEISADAGYCDEPNLRHLARRRINGYIAPGRARHGQKHAAGSRRWPKGSRKAAMATKLKRAGRRSRYRLRKQIVEPVFGQIKQAREFRQFLLRGLNKVRGEWAMICAVHNLLKLAKATG